MTLITHQNVDDDINNFNQIMMKITKNCDFNNITLKFGKNQNSQYHSDSVGMAP